MGKRLRILYDDAVWYPATIIEHKPLRQKYCVRFDCERGRVYLLSLDPERMLASATRPFRWIDQVPEAAQIPDEVRAGSPVARETDKNRKLAALVAASETQSATPVAADTSSDGCGVTTPTTRHSILFPSRPEHLLT